MIYTQNEKYDIFLSISFAFIKPEISANFLSEKVEYF